MGTASSFPAAPHSVAIVNNSVSTHSLSLRWQQDANGTQVQSFSLTREVVGSGVQQVVTGIKTGESCAAVCEEVIEGFVPNATYTLELAAVNGFGTGTPSYPPLVVTMMPGEPMRQAKAHFHHVGRVVAVMIAVRGVWVGGLAVCLRGLIVAALPCAQMSHRR